jgi:hypothetical protein
MPKGCKERFDFKFLHYVATFNFTRRHLLMQKFTKIMNEKRVVIIKSDKESELFLNTKIGNK